MSNALRQFLKGTALTELHRIACHRQWNETGLISSFYATLHSRKLGKPKQPVNAWLIYLMKQQRDEMQSQTQFVSAAAKRWREMTAMEKEPFIEHQKELALKYRGELESYNASLSRTDKEAHLEEFRKNKMKRQKRIEKKVDSTREGANLLKDATALWNSMSHEQKQVYGDAAAKDRERYIQEMQDYIRRMRQEGKLHLLPGKYQRIAAAEERKESKAKK